jgi:5-(carboxyamino)imidazole ribonucleotide synthase
MSAPLPPGATVGIVGGGQLGRMLVLVARRLGYRTVVLDPEPGSPAGQVADAQIVAELHEPAALAELATRADVLTVEWENADADALEAVAERVSVRPGPAILRVAQHRAREKAAAERFGVPTVPYAWVRAEEELEAALVRVGLPALLKTCRGGYDGRGQARVRSLEEARRAAADLRRLDDELVVERFFALDREFSVLVARAPSGAVALYEPIENHHCDGVLDWSLAPARLPPPAAARAQAAALALADGLRLEGLLAVEFFLTADGQVLFNEMAPRPHNSGHLTIEAAPTSQFEQALRAVLDLPLGPTGWRGPAAMVNLLGAHVGRPPLGGLAAALSAVPEAQVHWYGKSEARPRRKMGHLTVTADRAEDALARALAARERLAAHDAANMSANSASST